MEEEIEGAPVPHPLYAPPHSPWTMDNMTEPPTDLLTPAVVHELHLPSNTSSWNTHGFDLAVGVWLPGIICALGIVGNAVSLVVLSLDRSHSPTFLTLKALALSDVVLLCAALVQQVLPVYAYLAQCTNTLCLHYLAYIRVYVWPIICIAQMGSVYLTVLISAERYAAICKPLKTKRLRNISKVRWAICSVAVFSVVFNIPKFFEFMTVREEIPTGDEANSTMWIVITQGTELRRHPLYRYLYNTALYCLVMYALPLVVLTVLNTSIVRHMRRAHKRWGELNRMMQRELKATAVPLCIVFVFVLCGTQALVAFVLDAVFVDSDHHWLQFYTAIVNVFVIFNSAVNFVIFYMFGSKFRRLLKRAMPCSCCLGYSEILQGSPLLRRRFNPRSRHAHHLPEFSSNGITSLNCRQWDDQSTTQLNVL